MRFVRRWWRDRLVERHALGDREWERAVAAVPLARRLSPGDQARLRYLATLFMHDKDFYPAGGLSLTREMQLIIAATACVPVLHLGWDWMTGWHSIYVYPGHFRTRRLVRFEDGTEGHDSRILSGEAQHAGGMVLSWEDIAEDLEALDGGNVIVHEIAHKLDMRNGPADGYPPLRRGMSRTRWAEVMQKAFDDLSDRVAEGRQQIDAYAATNEAEFFAVTTEYAFEIPTHLGHVYPDVLAQLRQLYGI